MSKNTIYRFKDEMTLARALNHNMNWTIRQLQELARISKRQNNALLSLGIGLGLMALLWKMNSDDVEKLKAENQLLADEIDSLKEKHQLLASEHANLNVAHENLVDDVDEMHERIEALEEGRTQM